MIVIFDDDFVKDLHKKERDSFEKYFMGVVSNLKKLILREQEIKRILFYIFCNLYLELWTILLQKLSSLFAF